MIPMLPTECDISISILESETLVSEKKSCMGIGKIGLGKSLSIGQDFGLVSQTNILQSKVLKIFRKKSWYRYQKIWSREKSLVFGIGKFGLGKKVLVLVSEKFVSDKKSRSRYRSKIWSRHTVAPTELMLLTNISRPGWVVILL